MILINICKEIITEESALDGEAAESWMDVENAERTFKELVREIEGKQASQYPITSPENVWFTECGEMDYVTGEEENTSIHYSRDNSPNNLKYWIAAIKAAGFKTAGI